MHFGFAMGPLHIGGNDMKPVNSLFLITIRRLHFLPDMKKLLLCFLIPIGIGIIIGCGGDDDKDHDGDLGINIDRERDIEDLLKEDLVISWLTPEKEKVPFNQPIKVFFNQSTKVAVQVDYSGPATELSYRWMVKKGKIHSHSKLFNWTKCEETEGPVTVDIEVIYIAPEKADKETDTDRITFEVSNKGIKVSSAAVVELITPTDP